MLMLKAIQKKKDLCSFLFSVLNSGVVPVDSRNFALSNTFLITPFQSCFYHSSTSRRIYDKYFCQTCCFLKVWGQVVLHG